jgi:hypothetical protein
MHLRRCGLFGAIVTTETLTDFLLARIAEVEEGARSMQSVPPSAADVVSLSKVTTTHGMNPPVVTRKVTYDPARVLAECEAKRRIVQEYDWAYRQTSGDGLWIALRLLALPYADHPDYREEEWKP